VSDDPRDASDEVMAADDIAGKRGMLLRRSRSRSPGLGLTR
jgi:hypothetical protein